MIARGNRLTIIIMMCSLVVCSLILITSPWGNKAVIKLINQIEGVNFTYKKGSLLTALAFHEIKVTLDTGELTLNKVDASIDFWCSMQGKLCFDVIAINSLELEIVSNNNKKTTTKSISDSITTSLTEVTTFNSPITIEVKNTAINTSTLQINDISMAINTVSAHITLEKDQLSLISGHVNDIIMSVNSNSVNSNRVDNLTVKNTKEDRKESYQQAINQFQDAILATSSQIKLPLKLALQQLSIAHLLYQHRSNKDKVNQATNWNFSNTELSANWYQDKLTIKQFSTITPQLTIPSSTFEINLTKPYDIQSSINITSIHTTHWPAIIDTQWQLLLQGNINALTAKLSSKEIDFQGIANIDLADEKIPFTVKLNANNIPTLPLLTDHKATISSSFSGDIEQQSLDLATIMTGSDGAKTSMTLVAKHSSELFDITKLQVQQKETKSNLLMHGHLKVINDTLQWQLFAESPGFTLPTTDIKTLFAGLNKDLSSRLGNNSHNQINTSLKVSSQASTKNSSLSHAKKSTLPPYLPDIIEGRLAGNMVSQGSWQAGGWSLAIDDINVTGTLNHKPLVVLGEIKTNQFGFLSARVGTTGDLVIKLAQDFIKLKTTEINHQQIDVSFGIDKINYWYPPVKGSVDGSLIIKGDKQSPTFLFNTEVSHVNWQKLYSPKINVSAEYQPFNNHEVSLNLNAVDLIINKDTEQQDQNNLTVNSVNAVLSGNTTEQQLDIHWQGDVGGALRISGQNSTAKNNIAKNRLPKANLPLNHLAKNDSAEKNDSEKVWLGTIKRAHLKYKDAQWQIDKPINVQVDISKHQLQLDSHCWLGSGLSLCLPTDTIINQWGGSGQLALNLRQDLSTLNQFALPPTLSVKSILLGQIETQWSPQQNLTGKANFTISPGNLSFNSQYQQGIISQWQQGQLTLDLNDNQLTTSLLIEKDNNHPLIDASASVNFSEQLALNGSIELNQFSLQPLQAIINNVADLKGYISSNLTLGGTLNKPIINGSLSMVEGALLLNQSPNQLTHINSAMTINQNQATLQGDFEIEGKQANFTGEMSWQSVLSANIDLYAASLPLIFPPQLVAEVSPTLNLSLTNNHIMLSGKIDVLAGSYNIEKLPQGSINLSDDVVFVDNQGEKLITPESHVKLTTDVEVNINKAYKVYGQGLQTELQGQLALKQKAQQPLQVFGNIQSQQGTYQAYGQKLTIEQGELSFNGAVANPYINVRASRYINADDLTVGIDITGLTDALSMQLFSKPTLENAEILSFLTRGRGLDGENSNANAAASMLIGIGLSNSTQIFEQLEKIPLINNITLDTEGSDDNTQAVISGYVGDRVYLKYGIGVFEPINELTVRLYLLNRLWVEVVSGIEQSGDIYYSFDIE